MTEVVERLVTSHGEADTLIATHAQSLDDEEYVEEHCSQRIRYRHRSHPLISLLEYKGSHMDGRQDFIKNNRRYLSITSIANTVGHPPHSVLLGLHAFTGCDYTSGFHRKGKFRPCAQMVKDTSVQKAFS